MSLLRTLLGYRDDLDLRGKWWHRLAGVLYVVLFSGLSLFVLWLAADSSNPPREMANVRVLASLKELFKGEHEPPTNLAQLLADAGEQFGVTRANGRIAYLGRYYLEQSFCSKHALQAPEAVAEHLNRVNFTRDNTADSVKAVEFKGLVPGEDGACWFHEEVQKLLDGEAGSSLIAYEFTARARLGAAAGPIAKALGALLLVHFMLTALYYRGFVYVVCGPRRTSTGSET